MTKNDLYAILAREGVRRDYAVIPEFVLELDSDKAKSNTNRTTSKRAKSPPRPRARKIDLVWATRKGAGSPQNARNHRYWELKAAFEIEGCNVRNSPREFGRHKDSFCKVGMEYGRDVQSFVVLYTSAYDRDFHNKPHSSDRQVKERIEWGKNVGVEVLDGTDIERDLLDHFPRDNT